MKYEITDRGFAHLKPIPERTRWGDGERGEVRIYESSSATEPCIWISVVEVGESAATAELTLKSAKKLAKQLRWLVKNHYQVRSKSG